MNPEEVREQYRTAIAMAEAAFRWDGDAVHLLWNETPASDKAGVLMFLARLPSVMLRDAYGADGRPIDVAASFRRVLDSFAAGLPDVPPPGQGA